MVGDMTDVVSLFGDEDDGPAPGFHLLHVGVQLVLEVERSDG